MRRRPYRTGAGREGHYRWQNIFLLKRLASTSSSSRPRARAHLQGRPLGRRVAAEVLDPAHVEPGRLQRAPVVVVAAKPHHQGHPQVPKQVRVKGLARAPAPPLKFCDFVEQFFGRIVRSSIACHCCKWRRTAGGCDSQGQSGGWANWWRMRRHC